MASDVALLVDRAAAEAVAGLKGAACGDEEAALPRKKEDLDVRISVDGTSRKPLMEKGDRDVVMGACGSSFVVHGWQVGSHRCDVNVVDLTTLPYYFRPYIGFVYLYKYLLCRSRRIAS
jgi:hypothetical protein